MDAQGLWLVMIWSSFIKRTIVAFLNTEDTERTETSLPRAECGSILTHILHLPCLVNGLIDEVIASGTRLCGSIQPGNGRQLCKR
jgi:hypothetical protein